MSKKNPLFRYYCEANPEDDTTTTADTEAYDDTDTTTTTETSATVDAEANVVSQVTLEENAMGRQAQRPDTSSDKSSRGQLMELLFDIYCLLNGFFRSLLESNSIIRGKCHLKEQCGEMAILDILQRIVDREILVDEKCRKYPALIPMLTAINRKFQCAEGLFSEAVEEAAESEVSVTVLEAVRNLQNYFECLQVMSGTEKEVECDLQEIIAYLDYPLRVKRDN